MVGAYQRLTTRVARIEGRTLEQEYREKAASYFGLMLRRPRVVSVNSLWEAAEARLSDDELDDLLLADLIVQGYPRRQPELGEVWLVVEIALTVDQGDITRALRRAELLRKAGYCAIPVVAGEQVADGVEDEARSHKVVILQDGRNALWQEALEAWVSRFSTAV
ncbi:MAG: hypothetical protein N2508_03585 [Anaerolineae bacterium]|nr:hypothetical protein [Anaerolineae bacterium]